MKYITFFLILLSLFGCKTDKKQVLEYTDNEWRDILKNTLPLAEGNKPYIFKEFGNMESKDIISNIYSICTDLGYELNDSILKNINNRKNKPIKNNLDTMFNVGFVFDTSDFNYNYVIYSEPFYVNNEILCVSMSNKNVIENITLQWVFFFKKQKEALKIIEFYDFKKDKFFRPAPL